MINPYLGWPEIKMRQELTKLTGAYSALAAGALVVEIGDEGRTGVKYAKTDLRLLENLIHQLQSALGLLTNARRTHRAVPIGYLC